MSARRGPRWCFGLMHINEMQVVWAEPGPREASAQISVSVRYRESESGRI